MIGRLGEASGFGLGNTAITQLSYGVSFGRSFGICFGVNYGVSFGDRYGDLTAITQLILVSLVECTGVLPICAKWSQTVRRAQLLARGEFFRAFDNSK